MKIHPTALVAPEAALGKNVTIGPFCIVGPMASIEDDVTLESHVVIEGHVSVGKESHIGAFSAIGGAPQFLAYNGEPSCVVIGHNTTLREHVTVHRGTERGEMKTEVGNHCFLMVGTHVAHDCLIGDHVVMANQATLGGHCQIGNRAIIGGVTAIHQWVRIGHHAIVGGMSGVENDIIPYGSVLGNRAHLAGLNIIGLKRQGLLREEIHELRAAYRLLFANEGTLVERMEDVSKMFPVSQPIHDIISFMRVDSSRGLCLPV